MNNQFGRSAAFRSVLLVIGSTYFSYAVGLLASLVIARKLGPHAFGQYAYIVWLAGTLTILICNGLTLTAIRFLSDSLGKADVEEARRVQCLLNSWFLRSIVCVSVFFFVAYPWLRPAGWVETGWVFAISALGAAIAKAAYTFGTSISKGYGRFDIDAYTISLMGIFNLLGVALLATSGEPLLSYIVFFVAVSFGHAFLTRILMRRADITASATTGDVGRELKSRIANNYFWTTILFMVFALSNKTVETLFLNSFVGPEAVGWFAIAAAMTRGGIEMLSSGLTAVLMPIMSHAFGAQDEQRANRIFSDAVRYYFFLGLILAGGGIFWSGLVITVMYGAQYSPAILALQVMMLVGGLSMIENAIASLLTTTDNPSVRVALALSHVLITLLASIALVPRYGFQGALAAHALGRLSITVVSVVVASRYLKLRFPYLDLVRMLGAAAVGLGLALLILLVTTSLTAQFIAGVVYGLGCIAGSVWLRAWTTSDVQILSSVAQRLPRLRGIEQWLAARARDTR
jgi:O-antigen/teichoic acid export membrane protein